MSVEVVKIMRTAGRQLVDARLHDDVTFANLADVEAKWKILRYEVVFNLLRSGTPRNQIPEHWHWDWVAKANSAGTIGVRIFGIECENDWQGLAMTASIGFVTRLAPDTGKGLVYVKYVEAAPWNARTMTATPRFSAIGARLIEAAIRQSVDTGYEGRVGLHSLPASQPFYAKCGFVNLGLDAAVENLPYFELTSAAAAQFLKGGMP